MDNNQYNDISQFNENPQQPEVEQKGKSARSIVFASISLGTMVLSAMSWITVFLMVFAGIAMLPAFVFGLLGLIFGIKDKRVPAIVMSAIALVGIIIICVILVFALVALIVGVIADSNTAQALALLL